MPIHQEPKSTAEDNQISAGVDNDPVHGIDLVGYASIMARLASGQSRQALLSGAGLDEQKWQDVEKTWGLRLAKAAQQNDTRTLLAFEKGVAAAHRDSAPGDPTRGLAEYAAMVAALERGTSPIEVCAAADLKLAQFFELQQAWTRRIASDPALAATFRSMVQAAPAKNGDQH